MTRMRLCGANVAHDVVGPNAAGTLTTACGVHFPMRRATMAGLRDPDCKGCARVARAIASGESAVVAAFGGAVVVTMGDLPADVRAEARYEQYIADAQPIFA
jgi:hypothetical protein